MTHKHYFSIDARSYFELGFRRGELFGKFVRKSIQARKQEDAEGWQSDVERVKSYQDISRQTFPHLFNELRGFAQSARVSFDDLWLLNLEDEVSEFADEKCTTIVTNNCSLVAHNEDWEEDAANSVCVLHWRVGDLRLFELCYMYTIGGNAISVNSHGYVHAVNALLHSDHQEGVPKNLVARWLSETSSPDDDFRKLQGMKRASGFHHTLVSANGELWSIECSATRQLLERPECPFVHTNHYLSKLSRFEDEEEEDWISTRDRYRSASELVRNPMSTADMRLLVSDQSQGEQQSILNDRTIARVIVDLRRMNALVWLLCEEEKGWVSYDVSMPA